MLGTTVRGLALVLGLACPVLAQELGREEETPLRLGVLDGPLEETFGTITDVVRDSAGNVFVIDRYTPSIAWFDKDGAFRGRIGRKGRGPGEFVAPYAADVDASQRLHVVDTGNGRISVFDIANGNAVHHADVRLTLPAHDLCTLGTRRFLLTPAGRRLIREIDGEGRTVRRFGEPLKPDAQLAAEFGSLPPIPMNYGHIVCDSRRDVIYYLSQYMGIVRAYSTEGRTLWSVELPDFYRVDWRSRGSGCCVYAGNRETNTIYSIRSAAVDPQGMLRITVLETGRVTESGSFRRA